MRKFTVFSRHALSRIAERTQLTEERIAAILDAGHAVFVGRKPGFDREHWVFYSPDDDTCFVAIRDRLVGKVVTVLPLDYHANLAWKISEEACDQARRLFTESLSVEEQPIAVYQEEATRWVIAVQHFQDGRIRTTSLGKYPILPEHPDPETFFSWWQPNELEGNLRSRNIDPGLVTGVSIRRGNKGDPVFIDLN